MKPGLALDKLIGEKIMGWSDAEEYEAYGGRGVRAVAPGTVAGLNTGYKAKVPMPKWSTDIAAAWQVVEKLRDDNFSLEENSTYWKVYFGVEWAGAETAPHAICLAALAAMGVDEAR